MMLMGAVPAVAAVPAAAVPAAAAAVLVAVVAGNETTGFLKETNSLLVYASTALFFSLRLKGFN